MACGSFCGFRFNAIIINYVIEWTIASESTSDYEIVCSLYVSIRRSMHRNEWIFSFGKRAPFLWFFDIWKLSEPERNNAKNRDRDRDRPLCRHILLSILTFVSISFRFSVGFGLLNLMGFVVSVRLNYCLYFAFKCKYK